MKVVVAIDSMKGSLSSMEAGNAVKEGIQRAMDAEVIVRPLADGGEGTTEAFVEGMGGIPVEVEVTGPMGEKVQASYAFLEESKTAILEMAASSGIILMAGKTMNPMEATSYGVGEMIQDAIRRGCRDFIIGIGGSATNDCGIGMLSALGFEFYDPSGQKTGICAKDLEHVASISTEHIIPELSECSFKIACDVTNPLCGPNGATYVYGPQKGVTQDQLKPLDSIMAKFAACTKEQLGCDHANSSGAGAAGGLGFAFLSYLHADLEPGIELVTKAIKLEEYIRDADFVITGEGRMDEQTANGKVPVGVARIAKKYGAKTIAFAGSLTDGAVACNQAGIDAIFSIQKGIITLEEAMTYEVSYKNVRDAAEQVFRLIAAIR